AQAFYLGGPLRAQQDCEGTIWIGSHGSGLCRLEDGRFTRFTAADGLAGNIAAVVHEDESGALWIGGVDGLTRYKQGRFAKITMREALFDNQVFSLQDDDDGNYWMNCHRGIDRAPKQQLNEVADGKRARVECVSYGAADGMLSTEANGGSLPGSCKTRDGRLWFPTVKGVVVIDPKTVRSNADPPP